ncbi:MAG: hypothetical protein JNN30_04155 [Rhodanobacteraceae bacterium]|nr:hypothetical protein [Rhodanobacteraceae bacterium]
MHLKERVDTLARGWNEKKKLDKVPRGKVKHFKPQLHDGRLELSLFCMDELSESERWALLDKHSDKKPIPARSELSTASILQAGLSIDANWEPERHVNVLNWPEDEVEQTNSAQCLYAAQTLFMR